MAPKKIKKFTGLVLFCRNPDPGEKYFTAWNLKKDIEIQGKFDIKKILSLKARCKERTVVFPNKQKHKCFIFARIQDNMRTSELNDKLQVLEEAFTEENGTAAERYTSIIIDYPGRFLNGIEYKSISRTKGRPKPLPDAQVTKEYAALSTEAECLLSIFEARTENEHPAQRITKPRGQQCPLPCPIMPQLF